MFKTDIIDSLQQQQTQNYLKDYNITHLRLTGSYSRDEQKDASDIDLLYEYDATGPRRGRGLIDAKLFLEEKLGKSVDLSHVGSLRPNIAASLLSSKIPVF